MRITVEFEPLNNKLGLPLHYNREVQGMIYNNLDSTLANWIHDGGVEHA